MIVGENDEEEEASEVESDVEVEKIEYPVSISLSSVVGSENPKTMKLTGKINGKKVIVMIDPGATHNFISPGTVQLLSLPVTSTETFEVTLGNGEATKGCGVYKEVDLDLGPICITKNFLSLDLGHSEIILGIDWLAK